MLRNKIITRYSEPNNSFWVASIAFFWALPLYGQWTDSFSDGDFTANPVWTGSSATFTIDNGWLRLNQVPPAAGISYLATASTAIESAQWEFTVRLDFTPSGSNYAGVYLTSSQPDLSAALNGYFVLIGDTPREVSLYRQSGTTRTKIIDGTDNRVNTNPVLVRVRVNRDATGTWTLHTDTDPFDTFALEGSVTDVVHPASSWFGVFCEYTSTRSTLFYFDDFAVSGDPYTPPPPANAKDMVITEIFADPSPSRGLPEEEFVEVVNRSDDALNSNAWTITDGSSIGSFSVSPPWLPGERRILTEQDNVAMFSGYGTVVGVSNFPTLNNAGDVLVLKDGYGNEIDRVTYTDAWYNDDDKREGGWSLELIDTENICAEQDNWTASEHHLGATPGQVNSVAANKPDVTGPRLLTAIPASATEVTLSFNEKLWAQLPAPEDFTLTPATTVSTTAFYDATLRSLRLQLFQPLQPSVAYRVVAQVNDCAGNEIQPSFNSVVFGLPQPAEAGDVILNEILFNPKPYGVDFVEVHNTSEKFINLNGWTFANYENGVSSNAVQLSADVLLAPHGYVAFSTDGQTLLAHYPGAAAGQGVDVSHLPPMNDDEGTMALFSDGLVLMDYVRYEDDFHSVFLKDVEGVSLERIRPDVETNTPQNWKSAASSAGFATPGYRNSQSVAGADVTGTVTVVPEIFVPETGQPSFAEIRYTFAQGGRMAQVLIVDQQGRSVKLLANNELLATEGFFRWDGDRDDGGRARPGYYAVWFEVVDAAGITETYRKRVVIAVP
jgi:hypothetical protein